jgi:hypothetical protein
MYNYNKYLNKAVMKGMDLTKMLLPELVSLPAVPQNVE